MAFVALAFSACNSAITVKCKPLYLTLHLVHCHSGKEKYRYTIKTQCFNLIDTQYYVLFHIQCAIAKANKIHIVYPSPLLSQVGKGQVFLLSWVIVIILIYWVSVCQSYVAEAQGHPDISVSVFATQLKGLAQ